jgi:hypothetical protein
MKVTVDSLRCGQLNTILAHLQLVGAKEQIAGVWD